MKQVSFRLPKGLYLEFKVKVAKEDRTMTAVIVELIKEWVKDNADDTKDDTERN